MYGRVSHAVGEGVFELLDDPVGGQREVGFRADLGDEVVVVGVEPLGHFQRLLVLGAAGQGEVAVDVELALGVEEVPEAGGNGAEVGGGVEHLVVVGEGAGDGGGFGQAQALEALGGAELDLLGGGVEGGGVDLAGPVGLDGLLEFAAAADARVAQDRGSRERSGVESVLFSHGKVLGVGCREGEVVVVLSWRAGGRRRRAGLAAPRCATGCAAGGAGRACPAPPARRVCSLKV